jgi:hypothetical protein
MSNQLQIANTEINLSADAVKVATYRVLTQMIKAIDRPMDLLETEMRIIHADTREVHCGHNKLYLSINVTSGVVKLIIDRHTSLDIKKLYFEDDEHGKETYHLMVDKVAALIIQSKTFISSRDKYRPWVLLDEVLNSIRKED